MENKNIKELKSLAKSHGIKGFSIMNKNQLINAINVKWYLGLKEHPSPNSHQCIHAMGI